MWPSFAQYKIFTIIAGLVAIISVAGIYFLPPPVARPDGANLRVDLTIKQREYPSKILKAVSGYKINQAVIECLGKPRANGPPPECGSEAINDRVETDENGNAILWFVVPVAPHDLATNTVIRLNGPPLGGRGLLVRHQTVRVGHWRATLILLDQAPPIEDIPPNF